MRAMVFAAGLGTRLRPLTDRLPKPVIPLLHRPLGWYALDHLARAGVDHAVLNTHHLAERVREEIAGMPAIAGLELALAHEAALLGTGGGVKHAVATQSRALGPLDDREIVIAMNGDILFAPDLAAALALHRATDAYATMILRADPEVARYGAIEIDGASRVRRLLSVPATYPEALRPLMFTGVHVLSARAIADLPDTGCIIRQGYRRWLDRGEIISAHVEPSLWRDLGTPREYLAASLDLLRGALRWPGVDPSEAIHPTATVHPDATVVECVLGPGSRIEPGVALERAVVWPGTVVRASAHDAILTPETAVEAG